MVNNLWETFEAPTTPPPLKTPEMMMEGMAEEEPKQEPSWGSFDTPTNIQGDEVQDEDNVDFMVRNLVSGGARVLEQGLGRLGNTEKFMKDLMISFPKESTGPFGWAIRELIGQDRWEQMIRGKSGQETLLPTSEQIKEGVNKLTKGYTEPKSKGEKRFQEGVEDLSAVLFSGGRPRNLNIPANRVRAVANLGAPVAANVTKGIVEDLGFGDDIANKTKMGIWLGLNLAGNINGKRYASDLMNDARNGIPQNVNFNLPRLVRRLDDLLRDPQILGADPRSALARQQIEAIRRDIANGQRDVRSLMNTYDGINAAKRSRDMFSLSRSDQNFARRQIDKVRDAVRDEVMEAGRQYPNAINAWQNGIRAWSTIHQSQAITNFAEQLAKGPYGKLLVGPTAALFGVGSHTSSIPGFIKAGAIGGVPLAHKSGQLLYRIYNNQELSRYYFNAIRNAAENNSAGFIKNFNELNRALEKDEKKPKNPSSK